MDYFFKIPKPQHGIHAFNLFKQYIMCKIGILHAEFVCSIDIKLNIHMTYFNQIVMFTIRYEYIGSILNIQMIFYAIYYLDVDKGTRQL